MNAFPMLYRCAKLQQSRVIPLVLKVLECKRCGGPAINLYCGLCGMRAEIAGNPLSFYGQPRSQVA